MTRPLPVLDQTAERGFKCPDCGARMSAADSRQHELGLRRRRHCTVCTLRVTTIEQTATETKSGIWIRNQMVTREKAETIAAKLQAAVMEEFGFALVEEAASGGE